MNYGLYGDIGKLGQISFGKEYNECLKQSYLQDNFVKNTLIVSYDKLKTDSKILTIGDSFSQMKICGYQNYLGHLLNDSIINIAINATQFTTSINFAISLLNNGIIDSSNCQILILEQVDRNLISNLCKIDFDRQYKLPYNTEKQNNKNTNKNSQLYALCSWIRLQVNFKNPVVRFNLKRDYFSHNRYSHTLFIYQDDFMFKNVQPSDIEKAKENLILLNRKFSEKGIKMIFMIAADKYDVYRPFIMENSSLPIDITTDGLSNLHDICIINTKPILQEIVRRGEKDVYMVNDTHWSYKAHSEVAQKLARDIDSLGLLK
ncbi:MAG: hypothetical protein LBG92_06585 [Prevotellaceae bacterium]|jgi:hypothetical protein|nr:hypothetical protein [Prevotellaceae bacterium]